MPHLNAHRLASALAVASLTFAVGGCKKEEPPPPTVACVLTDDQDKPRQCFEWTQAGERARYVERCQDLEAFPGGKKALVDGPCPVEGRLGICRQASPPSAQACYAHVDRCRASCAPPAIWE